MVPSTSSRRTGRPAIGVVGFCMGGGLALVLACQRPDAVKAVVPAYGLIPWPDAQPDYSKLDAAVLIHAGALDTMFSPDAAHALETELTGLGKDVSFHHLSRVSTTPSSTRTGPRCTTAHRPTCSGSAPWPSSASTCADPRWAGPRWSMTT